MNGAGDGALYVSVAWVMLLMVKVTLAAFVLPVVTVHVPLEVVTQLALPAKPPLHVPLTVALATGALLWSSTWIVTRACQF